LVSVLLINAQSAEDAYSSYAPDPTFAFAGGPCCPADTRFNVCPLDYDYVWHLVNFAILYVNGIAYTYAAWLFENE
jgi:hypothetical protein